MPSYFKEKLGVNSQSVRVEQFQPSLPSIASLDAHLSMPLDVMKKIKHKQKQIVLAKAADAVSDALAATSGVPLCELQNV